MRRMMPRLMRSAGLLVCLGASVGCAPKLVALSRYEAAGRPLLKMSAATKGCYICHLKNTPVIAGAWADSKHADAGIGCSECHRASATDRATAKHYGQIITTKPSQHCDTCHRDDT